MSIMAAKQIHVMGSNELDRLRQENLLLREELQSLRNEVLNERKIRARFAESYQNFPPEGRKKAQNFAESVVEKNEELKERISSFQGRPLRVNNNRFGGRNQLELLANRLESMHRDLIESSLMSNLKGKHIVNQDNVDNLANNFRRVLTGLQSLHTMLSQNRESTLSMGRQGPKTKGLASNSQDASSTEDLVFLDGPVTENALLCNLKDRLTTGHCVTKLGPVLVSLNNFNPISEELSRFSPDMMHLETSVKQTINKLMERDIPQVFVLSGFCGSGKTYTSQILSRLILEQGYGELESDVSKHFLASISVLQALGSAKTLANLDSSRVGYLYEFQFIDGNITRTKIQSYQLDTTRVTGPPADEGNYHIFYEMLSGINQDERAKLQLQGYTFYNLNYLSECHLPDKDQEDYWKIEFEKWRVGLSTLGIPLPDVLRILAAILLLGNVHFVEGEGLELDVKGNNEIKAVAALLGVSGVSLYRGLTTKTKNLRGQVFRSLCEPAVANFNRDALATSLYSRTVAAIARRVNSFKRPTSSTTNSQGIGESSLGSGLSNGVITVQPGSPIFSPVRSFKNGLPASSKGISGLVSIMDMLGFENTKVNQLEQLCINLCSETVQHFYNTHIFKSSEEYCREEDIFNDFDIDYVDNATCIELMTCQRTGIFTLLDSETTSGTHESFVENIRQEHKNAPCFFDPDPCSTHKFGVSHHADNVVYDAQNLICINRDAIPDDIVCIFSRQNCNFGFASHLFTSDLKASQGQTAAPRGVLHRISPTQEQNSLLGSYDYSLTTFCQDFQSKLDHLLKTLVQAEPVFIRCIKANNVTKPNVFDRHVVSQQLRALQVFETVQLLQSEVAHHCRFEAFINKYGHLSTRPLGGVKETEPDDCAAILECLSDASHHCWIIGTKYIFFSDIVQQELDSCLTKGQLSAVVILQAAVRGWLCRKQWKNFKRSLEMQRKARQNTRSNQKHATSRHVASSHHELNVEEKAAEQMCCLYGLDMETPPPLPKSRPYTVMGNMKMGFPQTRVMKQDLKDGEGLVLLHKGEQVKIVGAARKRGYLLVEHRGGTNIQVPFQFTELKVSPHSSPR